MNHGAKAGNFAHDTGEGGTLALPPRGRRRPDLADRHRLLRLPRRERRLRPGGVPHDTPRLPQVKMIEIKVSQGAKPGHGGILPGGQGHRTRSPRRGSSRRARTCSRRPTTRRSRPRWRWWRSSRSCASSPAASRSASRSASATHASSWPSSRRCSQTGIYADFIVVDGGEGGTGAAPLEFSDSLGAPLHRGPDARPEHPRRRRHPRPVQDRRQRQDGHRLRDGPLDGARRRLVQLGARLHVRRRLHPVPALPHQPVPGRRHHPGPEAPARARRPRQGRAGAQLPPEHRARARRDDRRDGSRPHRASSARITSFAG